MFFYFNYFPGFPAVLGIDRTGTCSPEVAIKGSINISAFSITPDGIFSHFVTHLRTAKVMLSH